MCIRYQLYTHSAKDSLRNSLDEQAKYVVDTDTGMLWQAHADGRDDGLARQD